MRILVDDPVPVDAAYSAAQMGLPVHIRAGWQRSLPGVEFARSAAPGHS
jgi:hypothetical protein